MPEYRGEKKPTPREDGAPYPHPRTALSLATCSSSKVRCSSIKKTGKKKEKGGSHEKSDSLRRQRWGLSVIIKKKMSGVIPIPQKEGGTSARASSEKSKGSGTPLDPAS